MKKTIASILFCILANATFAQEYNQIDDSGNITQRGGSNSNRNFNKHNNDTTKNKEIPKGIYVWTIDKKFGDITPAVVDTMPHLFQNTIFNTGIYGDYNTTGNNYTARLNRIFIDRPQTEQFVFTEAYSHILNRPENFHFTNTLSPITNITYDNCGDKTNGEDHINAKFAVNAGKKLGVGFDIDYSYARGYYNAQSTSHFGSTLYASYLGDRYNMHAIFSTYHQKASENGGITNDNYITHPETFDDSFTENEIPTVLERNWNRNNSQHLFFTHKYSLGFYKKVKMTPEEIKAREFAKASKKEHDTKAKLNAKKIDEDERKISNQYSEEPTGRPDDAIIAGDEPAAVEKIDSTNISIASTQNTDSLMAIKAHEDSINNTMKDIFVPVTSFIHTLDINRHDRIYQAYETPNDYYKNTYYNYRPGHTYGGDSIYDKTKYLSVKNTLGIALLEGFNKYAKAGLKVFGSHELRKFNMPDLVSETDDTYTLSEWNEHSISIGGQIHKTQGKTLHYKLMAETWIAGEDAGQLKVDFSTDLKFPLFGDSITLSAKAYFYRLNPTFYQRNYHSKHLWWDNNDLDKETRTRIEGQFNYKKTRTGIRVAIEEIQNYTYFKMSYNTTSAGRTNLNAGVGQHSGNINLLTAQLRQDFKFGPLNWENIITYQNSSNENILPLPSLNIFTNLYLKFKIVNELAVELGADAYFFTKYYAPDFCPQINNYAIQENPESKVEIGGYPFIDVYANMHLKRTRFFVMFSHVNAGNGSRMYFLTPHYPQNSRVLRLGLSWNFFN